MFPLRKNYLRRLLREAGFERVRTYGDFQEIYDEQQPDFFIHVAEKSPSSNGRMLTAGFDLTPSTPRTKARTK
jgi:sarcosine/dimethylglycine N-methyltransferase